MLVLIEYAFFAQVLDTANIPGLFFISFSGSEKIRVFHFAD